LADAAEVGILNVLDDHSRLLVASHARMTTKAADVVASFHQAAAAYGFPASLLTDNGAIFTAAPRGGGRCAIELELDALGIAARHARPTTPDLRQGGALPPDPETLAGPPALPHHDRRPAGPARLVRQLLQPPAAASSTGPPPPAAAFAARPKATPTRPGLQAPSHYRVRHDKVDRTGVITLRHNSRLHHIGLGRRHAGVRVLVLVADLDVRVITEHGELLRELTLDPGRDYQPQHQP
jgi:hypothetical protein